MNEEKIKFRTTNHNVAMLPGSISPQEKRIADFLSKLVIDPIVMRYTLDGPVSIIGRKGGVSFYIVPSPEPTRNPLIRLRVLNTSGRIVHRDIIRLNVLYKTVKHSLSEETPAYMSHSTGILSLEEHRMYPILNVPPRQIPRLINEIGGIRERIMFNPMPMPTLSPEATERLNKLVKETLDKINEETFGS